MMNLWIDWILNSWNYIEPLHTPLPMAWIVCALRLESRMTPKRIGVKGGIVVCSSASSKYHGLDLSFFSIFQFMYLLQLALLWCSCVTPQYSVAWHLPGDLPMFPGLSLLASSVSWKHFLSFLRVVLVFFFTRTYLGLITRFRIAHLHYLELGEVISDDQFLSWIWYSYKTLKLALQRRLGIELSTQACTKNNTVTKHQNPPSTQPLGLSNTHFSLLTKHTPSIPASTLTSAVWQNSTKAGLLESKKTVQVLWGTRLRCYALHKMNQDALSNSCSIRPSAGFPLFPTCCDVCQVFL